VFISKAEKQQIHESINFLMEKVLLLMNMNENSGERKKRNWSPEARAKASQRMKDWHAKRSSKEEAQ